MTPPLALTLTFDGHRIRMAGTPERPEWVGKDVCRVLGLHGASHIARDVPDAEKGVANLATPGGPQPYATVKEAGLWRLISRSRKPSAARFQSWLFSEVLPSIRKHGCYPPPAVATREQQLAAAVLLAQEVIAERDARLALAEPKAATLDAIAESDGELALQDVGRHLGLGPNRTIWQMEDDGILFRGTHGTLTPHAQWIEAGYFRFVVTKPDETGRTFGQTKVTKRGLVWLASRYQTRPVVVALECRPSEASH
jgi:anti-repressor protein